MGHNYAKLTIYLGLLGLSACAESRAEARPAPARPAPTEVSVVTLQTGSVTLRTTLVGRTAASMVSEVRPQVTGIVRARRFEEGATVREGQVLYEIDAASYRAARDQARAALETARATLEAARVKNERYAELRKIDGVSKQDADDVSASYRVATADVAQKKAALESANINLQYTQVKAPIAGRIGKSATTPGALVTSGQTDALATIRVLDPIYVDLTESSAALLELRRMRAQANMQPGSAAVNLTLVDGTTYSHKGVLKFSEVAVDEATGAVTLRAEFPNPEGMLLPGMYVDASLDEANQTDGLLAPQRGVTRTPKGDATALVVTQDNKVEQRTVTTLRAMGDQWLIGSGLAAGDRVIVEGLNKVRAGDVVRPVPFDTTARAEL